MERTAISLTESESQRFFELRDRYQDASVEVHKALLDLHAARMVKPGQGLPPASDGDVRSWNAQHAREAIDRIRTAAAAHLKLGAAQALQADALHNVNEFLDILKAKLIARGDHVE